MIRLKRYRLFGIFRLCEGRRSDLPKKNGMLVFGVGGYFSSVSDDQSVIIHHLSLLNDLLYSHYY